METRRLARHLTTAALWTVLLVVWAVPARGELMITFGGMNPVTIRDTDSGQNPGVINFGLTSDQGYGLIGRLTAQTSAGFSQVNLESFQANFLVAAPGGPLTVTFQDTFNGPTPIPPVIATDSITAFFSNIYGSNQIGGLNSLVEGAFVGMKFINPIMSSGNNGPITFNPPAGIFIGIADGHGPAQFLMGAPPWTLEGSFMFTLGDRVAGVPGFPGDSLTYSQAIRITAVSEPPSLILLGIGLLCLVAPALAAVGPRSHEP